MALKLGLCLLTCVGCGRLSFDGLYDEDIIVTTTADTVDANDPDISLREALLMVDATAGSRYIGFAPALSGKVIAIATELPALRAEQTMIDGDGVIIDAEPGYTGPLLTLSGRTNTVSGLTFRGAGTRMQLASATDAMITRNQFEGGGIAIAGSGYRLEIVDNEIFAAGSHGIDLTDSSDVVIRRNDIVDVAGDPVIVRSSSRIEVDRNWIVIGAGSTGNGIVFQGVTGANIHDNLVDPGVAHLVRLTDSPDVQIVGNILEAGDASVVIEGTSTNAFVFRNVMMMPVYEPIYVAATATGAVIVNNTFYLCGNGVVTSAIDLVEANTLDADTGYVDPGGYDFRLTPDNPAIDQGSDLGLDMTPTTSGRFLGAAPDLGAVESY